MSTLIGQLGNLASPPTITPACRLSLGGAIARTGAGAAASGASPWSDAANCLLACPFVLETKTTFYKGFWVNGTAAGGNTEVGIWDSAYNKITTTGSVAGSGNSVPQVAALAATTTVPPGNYYMGIAHSATTTGQLYRWAAALSAYWQALGCWKQASITLGSLAATATPGDMTNVAFPIFGLITRSVFDV
jgi:hypothetical protein